MPRLPLRACPTGLLFPFTPQRYLRLGLALLLALTVVGAEQNIQPFAIVRAQGSNGVRISQIYGGGGNTGAPYQADFIELFNASPNPVDLTGWSVQYAAKAGATWQMTPLANIIPGYGFLLIQQSSGANGAPLPTPDAVGTLALAATDGKVALVSGQALISGLGDPAVVDFVGYGAADAAEGSPTAKLSNTKAALRQGNGCTDSNNNSADFDVVAPAPRNSTSAPLPCAQPATDTPTATLLPTDTPTAVVIDTPTPTSTETPSETPTSVIMPPDTPTDTPISPITDTPVVTATATLAPLPTDTPLPVVDTPTPVPTNTEIVVIETPTPVPPATPTPLPTDTPLPTAPPRIFITELLVDPQSVTDANGEWIELFNPTGTAVNLRGWMLRDLRTDSHTIAVDLLIQPGQYLLLARNGDSATNGGVAANYLYTGINLANTTDELLLVDPTGQTIDSVAWGGVTGIALTAGASLERADLGDPALWETAKAPWPGSLGDLGSPGAGFVGPLPSPTPTFTPVITVTLLPIDTPTATPPAGAPRLLISEFLADPQAVSDANGEWIELFNAGESAINLRGWIVADLGSERHTINADLLIQPGQYLVLARNGDPAANGGVIAGYRYTGFSLANSEDEILLIDPNQVMVDQVAWGGTAPWSITSGAALERTTWVEPVTWATATTLWPGSASDFGSPGSAWAPTLPSLTPTPMLTATATLTATLPSPVTPGPPARLYLSEFLADPKAVGDTGGEWIELFNAGENAINLRGWTLADLGSERHTISTDLIIEPGQYLVLARNGDPASNGGVTAAYVYNGFSLANGDDEILLIDPNGVTLDQVAWGGDNPLTVKAGVSYERTNFADPLAWAYAPSPWPGSAGDLGTPGAAASGPPATATPPGGSPPDAQPAPRLLISEFLADPQAVDDAEGEWIEIYNASADAVNLRGWTLADLGNERHTINAELIIQPGQYLVLARNGDFASNGGVTAAYVYSGLALGNRQDAILLLTPTGAQVDQVAWGDVVGLPVRAGVSYERTTLADPAQWTLAQSPWPGATGDQGTPGAAYSATPAPGPPATPLPTTTPLGATWVPASAPSSLLIEEVAYQGSDAEFVALHNASAGAVDLGGWGVGDAHLPGNNEGIYALPAGVPLAPGGIYVVARNGAAFRQEYGRAADAEIEATDPNTPDLARRRDLASGTFALSDSGDEIVLIDPAGQLADAVAFADGDYAALQVSGLWRPPQDYSLQAVPSARYPVVADVRQRFLAAPPRPFAVRGLPLAQIYPAVSLDEGLVAVWGSLGGHSNFSHNYTAPPHYLLAAAGAQGLDFMALADPALAPLVSDPGPTLRLDAWGWQSNADQQAVVYSSDEVGAADQGSLLDYLAATGAMAQWQGDHPPNVAALPAFAADSAAAPGALSALLECWQAVGAPLLPAGNANPELPGAISPTPRYTGFAVTQADHASLLAALAARRGWLTNRPGLWLTLRATGADGAHWMGSQIAAQNQVTLQLAVGDRSGERAGLAIWQDNRPVRQLDLPPADGRWTVTLPAIPNTFLYAVATQADGDFAITAPLRVLPSDAGTVVLNEVLPAPAADHNQDGKVDGNDEFTELYNPGDQPVSLVGWQLSDNTGDADPTRRFTFGVGRAINGREHLFLWRKESRINLNVENDYVRLLNPAGVEVDRVDWGASPDQGLSISRLPDGGAWFHGAQVTPGQRNRRVGERDPALPPLPPKKEVEPANVAATAGQAGGPPGSVAQAKLAGLEAFVEFQAVVIAPPGLFNQSIYVADPAPGPAGPFAGIGINVYLRSADFPPLQVGDRVRVRGVLKSFRGELELQMASAADIWQAGPGLPLEPLPVTISEIGETLEGRLVTFSGVVSSWQGENIFLSDPLDPSAAPARITVRSSLPWKRPFVNKGQRWRVIGVVGQFAKEAPWNGGYRVLVRFQEDLGRVRER